MLYFMRKSSLFHINQRLQTPWQNLQPIPRNGEHRTSASTTFSQLQPISDQSVEDVRQEEQGGASPALRIEAQPVGRSTTGSELQTEAPSPALTKRGPAPAQGVR